MSAMPGDEGALPEDGNDVVIRIASAADLSALARLRYDWRVGEGERGLDGPSFENALVHLGRSA